MKILIFFLLKSKYPNPIQNNRNQTKNIRTRPEVQKLPERVLYPYIEIPKNPKYPIRSRTGIRTPTPTYRPKLF